MENFSTDFAAGKEKLKTAELWNGFPPNRVQSRIPLTYETAEWFAEIKQNLRTKGKPIPINDVWIAAHAMEHGAALLSYDSHFEEIDGLLRYRTAN